MKIETNNLKTLLTKHICQLSEEEFMALAFLSDIVISEYKKTEWQIKFKITNGSSTVFVECSSQSCMSMGRSNKVKKSLSGLTSWGGCFSFASCVQVFRGFFCDEFEFIISSPEKRKLYSEKELNENFLLINELVDAA